MNQINTVNKKILILISFGVLIILNILALGVFFRSQKNLSPISYGNGSLGNIHIRQTLFNVENEPIFLLSDRENKQYLQYLEENSWIEIKFPEKIEKSDLIVTLDENQNFYIYTIVDSQLAIFKYDLIKQLWQQVNKINEPIKFNRDLKFNVSPHGSVFASFVYDDKLYVYKSVDKENWEFVTQTSKKDISLGEVLQFEIDDKEQLYFLTIDVDTSLKMIYWDLENWHISPQIATLLSKDELVLFKKDKLISPLFHSSIEDTMLLIDQKTMIRNCCELIVSSTNDIYVTWVRASREIEMHQWNNKSKTWQQILFYEYSKISYNYISGLNSTVDNMGNVYLVYINKKNDLFNRQYLEINKWDGVKWDISRVNLSKFITVARPFISISEDHTIYLSWFNKQPADGYVIFKVRLE